MDRRWIAEAVGTFALLFVGAGAITINSVTGGAVTHVGIAMTFGLIVMSMIFAIGDVSGAHINPAVTIAFVAARRMSTRDALPYILSQFVGAIAASFLLRAMLPEAATLGQTLPAGSALQSFALEVVLTWLLMFVVLAVATGAKERGIMAGATIGATVMLDALFAGPISGASMNPARSLGPALASGELTSLWVYLTAPVAGALLAVPFCRLVHGAKCCSAAQGAVE